MIIRLVDFQHSILAHDFEFVRVYTCVFVLVVIIQHAQSCFLFHMQIFFLLFSFIHMRNPDKSSLPSNNHMLVVILSSSFKILDHFPPSMKQLVKLIFFGQQDDFIL
jgi:hypothetical protein